MSRMSKIKVFAVRNVKEILRDPLSYIFALGFPVVMLIIMTIVNNSIPPEAGMDIFELKNLAPGVVLFGFTFVMLFTAILMAKDRCGSFLERLYAAPVTAAQFITGYIAPIMVLGVLQCIITYAAAMIIGLVTGDSLSLGGMMFSIVLLLPCLLMFISLGLLFGGIFNDKAAPGICSILITVATILGGVWMDIKTVGGGLFKIAEILPFYPAVNLARGAVNGCSDGRGMGLAVTLAYAAAALLGAVLIFRKNMRKI